MIDFVVNGLMFPISELRLDLNPYAVIALNSLCWAFFGWCAIQIFQRAKVKK